MPQRISAPILFFFPLALLFVFLLGVKIEIMPHRCTQEPWPCDLMPSVTLQLYLLQLKLLLIGYFAMHML